MLGSSSEVDDSSSTGGLLKLVPRRQDSISAIAGLTERREAGGVDAEGAVQLVPGDPVEVEGMIGGAVVGTEAGAEAAAAAFNPSEEDPPEEVNEGAPAPSASVRPAPSAGAADVVRAEELGTGEGGDRPELAPPPARSSRRPS